MADEYAACWSPRGNAKGRSTEDLSVIDISKIASIVPVLKSLTNELKPGLATDYDQYHDMIGEAGGEASPGRPLYR